MGRKNNCMDISSNKQTKSHTRRPRHAQEREIESLLKAAQNQTIRTNKVKEKIDTTQ